MTTGDLVWSALGGAWVLWLALTVVDRRLVGPVRLIRPIVSRRLGRLLVLAAWGGVGWHLFCQRP